MRALFGGDATWRSPTLGGPAYFNRESMTMTLWDSEVGGTQVTDLLAADGSTPISSVAVTGPTSPLFYGPDDVTILWAELPNDKGGREPMRGVVEGAALSATFGPPGGYSSLPSPVIIGHRGAAGVYPEHTMEGYRAAVAAGVKVLELDIRRLKDGLVVMHDTTVDRTTTATGNVTDYTTARMATMAVDAGTWFGYGWPNDMRVPLFADVLREFGNKVVLSCEAINTGSGALIADELQAHKISPDHAIVTAYNTAEVAAANAAGYLTGIITDTDDPATLAAAGVDVAICSTSATEAYIASAKSAGLDVWVYGVNRHYLRDYYNGLGVRGLVSDEPAYLTRTTALTTTDTFVNKMPNHGWLANSKANRGVFAGTDEWGYDTTASQHQATLLGDLCPFADGDNFTLDFTCRWVATAAANSWFSIYLCDKDRRWDDPGVAGDYGYHFLMRKDGSVAIYRVDNGVPTMIRSTPGTAIVDGTTATYRITVSPTELRNERLDVLTSGVQADTTYRNLRYATFGRYGANGYFKDVAYAAV